MNKNYFYWLGLAMNSLLVMSKEHSKTDWTQPWTDILSSFCSTNLKKAIRSVIHSRNKHGMICSPCSMENLSLNMKRVSLNSVIRNYWNIILMWRIYLRLRDFLGMKFNKRYQQKIMYGIITSKYTIISIWLLVFIFTVFMHTIADVGTPRCTFVS